MKTLKIAGASVVALVVVLTAVGFILPSRQRVVRTVEVQAPVSAVFPLINNLKTGWTQWNPFVSPDDKTYQVSYSGPEEGVGASQAWDGEKTGEGKLKIIRADPTRGIDYQVMLMHDSYRLDSSFTCEPKGQVTQVTWTCDMEVGNNPLRRYFGLTMDRFLGGEMERGLGAIKAKSEAAVAAAPKQAAAATATP
ncbi:MAG TPA: SRPBCC family protein [Myxococcales bacterium]|nr:SRPBCC family protein [Myxococcales bacterium]